MSGESRLKPVSAEPSDQDLGDCLSGYLYVERSAALPGIRNPTTRALLETLAAHNPRPRSILEKRLRTADDIVAFAALMTAGLLTASKNNLQITDDGRYSGFEAVVGRFPSRHVLSYATFTAAGILDDLEVQLGEVALKKPVGGWPEQDPPEPEWRDGVQR